MVTLLASQLVNRTVVDQFRSQELQLVSSLAQQTESYFTSLGADLNSLALEPTIKTVLYDPEHTEGINLMSEHAGAYSGVIRTIARLDEDGEPRYVWPAELNAQLQAGERLPYGLSSTVVADVQDRAARGERIDIMLIPASRRDDPRGTFLLVATVSTDLRKTEFIVYELNLDALFSQTLGFIQLDSSGQLWVIDSVNEMLFQANAGIPLSSLYKQIPLASLSSFRQPSVEEYSSGGKDRLAAIAPIRTQGGTFVVVLSRNTDDAQAQVRTDLQQIFALTAGAILSIAAMAWLALRRISREASRRQEEEQRKMTARTLLEVSRALNSTLNLEDVLRSIMAELSKIVPYDSAAVFLVDRSKLVVAAHRGEDTAEHDVTEFELDEAHAAKEVIQTGKPLVIHDTQLDERWATITTESQIRSWMGIPLRVREKTVGVLNINSHTPGQFTPEEIELAEAFADQASVALQNARLHDVEVKQIEQELTIAHDIQMSLLPSTTPELPQLEIAAVTFPARQVSGDYFQYLPMPNGRLGIAVGDVSGKGIPAAMLMAVITTAMRDEVVRNARPADLMNALNQRLLERMKSTHVNSALIVGMFDPPTRHLELSNGGMVQPYVRNGQTWEYIPIGGYPLGLSQRMAYESKTVTLAPGSLVLIASDGVIEAQNPEGEFYGFERLEALLNTLPDAISAQGVIDQILVSVREFLAGEEPQDDLTIVVLHSLEVTGPIETPSGAVLSAEA
jgi:serine phosphatase RsbU (regulator of sigma subunit)